jgi:hypothetical protein
MTTDDYVGVILGTFTFFVWGLIGLMTLLARRGMQWRCGLPISSATATAAVARRVEGAGANG